MGAGGSAGGASSNSLAGVKCAHLVCGAGQACCGWDISSSLPECGSANPKGAPDPCYSEYKGLFYSTCDGNEDCAADEFCGYILGNYSYGFSCFKKADTTYTDGMACHTTADCPKGLTCQTIYPIGPFSVCKTP